jgi:transcriptional antiterminator NusG
MAKQWYVVHAYSNFEGKVKASLEEHIRLAGMEDKFGQILIPTEEVVEIRDGVKRRSERKFFPGYEPAPITEKEAMNIMNAVAEGVEKPKPKVLYQPGEVVRVIDGPFNDFNGVVEEVDYDRNRLKVAVLIFGRSTPVDLEFGQVEKG